RHAGVTLDRKPRARCLDPVCRRQALNLSGEVAPAAEVADVLDGGVAEDKVEGAIGKRPREVAGICLGAAKLSAKFGSDVDRFEIDQRHVKFQIDESPEVRRTAEVEDTRSGKQTGERDHLLHSLGPPATYERV